MISLIHPSRSRPQLAGKAARSWIENAGRPVDYILSLDKDDPLHYQYAPEFPFGMDYVRQVTNSNRSAIDAINNATKISYGDIIVVMSDDFECFPGWAKSIENLMKKKADWILKTQDGIQDWIITLPIMDRAYYNRFNYIYHPSYKHQWCDTEMTCVAELTGCLVNTKMAFKHLNIGETKIVDEISKRNDATFKSGKKNFIERKKMNFGLSRWDMIGTLSDNIYTRMQ